MTRRLVVSILLVLAAAAATAQELPIQNSILQQYNLTVWTDREGLPSPRVMAMAQTTDGYLWLGTIDGLVRFDGTAFSTWEAIGFTPLPASRVASLWPSPDGSLWVGYGSGTVAKITGARATVYAETTRATDGTLNAIIGDRRGVVWIASRRGLLKMEGDRVAVVSGSEGIPAGPVLNVHEDADGDLWVSSNTGVFRRQQGKASFEPFMSASYFNHRITVDHARAIWITDPREGFLRLTQTPGGRLRVARPSHAGLGVQVLASRRNGVWVATLGQGLWRVREPGVADTVEVFGSEQGLLTEMVRCLLEDREQNIWIGTDHGLYRLSLNKIIPIDPGRVPRVVQADDTGMWVGTTSGLLRFAGSRQQVFGDRGELPSPFVSAMHLDSRDALWIATDRGIAVYEGGALRRQPVRGIERLNRIYSMTIDADGRLWLADYNLGLFRVDGTELTAIDVPPVLNHRSVLRVAADSEGRIWLGLSDGRIGYLTADASGLAFVVPDGLPRRSATLNAILTRPGEVWLLTSDGAWQYHDGRFTVLSDANGLPSGRVAGGVLDRDGGVWLALSGGIVRVDRTALARVRDDPTARVTYGYWEYHSAGGALNAAGLPAMSRDPAGRIWFVTANGLSVAVPELLRHAAKLPRVTIQSVAIGSRRLPIDAGLQLPPRSSPIQIDYATVTLSPSREVRFQYRLDNFDDTWTDAGTRRQALFTNLPPGAYTFRVMAIATDGSSSESSTTLQFAVTPSFTQTAWFYGSVGVVIVLAVWQAWRVRLRYLQRQFALVINERIRMSREIHDTLLQSLVGVALQLDALGADETNPEPARAKLIRMRQELEEDIRDTRQSIWNLRSPKLDADLGTLLQEAGRRIAAGAPVQVTVKTSGTVRKLGHDVERQIVRIAEQAIVNAVRHASATEVDVELEFDAAQVCLRVIDNGRGFDQTQIFGESNLHFGLASMRERAEGIGGRFALRSEPGRGTVVEAVVPA